MATSDKYNVIANYGDQPQQVAIRTNLNIRDDASRFARLIRRVQAPAVLVADQLVEAEAFRDNPLWYREAGTGAYFWAGAGDPMAPAPPPLPTGIVTRLRGDGTILPLDIAGVKTLYGTLQYQEATPTGAIKINDGWEAENIVPLEHAVLEEVHARSLRVHKKALPSFIAVLDAIAADNTGVKDKLLTCAGTFVPRHKAWNPARELSPHSWGIAIDFNAEWNPYGRSPALPGSKGSLFELVPFFAKAGFAWGGHFSGANCDGMHFELARNALS